MENNVVFSVRFRFHLVGFIRLAVSVNQYMHKICKYAHRSKSAVQAFENVPGQNVHEVLTHDSARVRLCTGNFGCWRNISLWKSTKMSFGQPFSPALYCMQLL